MTKFKKGDGIADPKIPKYKLGIISSIDTNHWDNQKHYSILWNSMSFTVGYPTEKFDKDYILYEENMTDKNDDKKWDKDSVARQRHTGARLYMLVRTDMETMTAGRIAAQVSHATSVFHENVLSANQSAGEAFYDWKEEAIDFGTVIVLDAGDEADLIELTENLSDYYYVGNVIDPEYPIRDGNAIHIIDNVLTCAFAFYKGPEGHDTELKHLELL